MFSIGSVFVVLYTNIISSIEKRIAKYVVDGRFETKQSIL